MEFYSVMRSVRAIENADVCLLVIDATQGFEAQDMNIFHLADSNRKGIVILVNKWDLVDKSHNTARDFEKGDPRKDKPLYRRAHPVHLRFGETAHLQSGRNGRPRV